MKDLKQHYSQKSEFAVQQLKTMATKTNLLVALRVLAFGLIILLGYLFWGNLILEVLNIIVLGFIFMVLIKWHGMYDAKKEYWNAVHQFYENEIKALENDFEWAKDGAEYKISQHEFAHDMDLFGNLSFFHKINRTNTLGGENYLAKQFLSNDNKNIIAKQKAVTELSELLDFQEQFVGTSRTNKSDLKPELLQGWFKNYQPAMKKNIKYILWVFPIISIVLLSLYISEMIAGIIFGGWFTLGLIVTGLLIRNTIKFSIEINRIADNINTYGSLLDLIEKQKFSSVILENIQKNIRQDNNQASAMFKSFSKKVDLFNNRNNFLVGIFGNALLLWDSQTIFALEKWITNNKETVSNWISGIFEMDALLSLSLYRFNHPHFRFPTLLSQEDKTLLKAEEIGHPLLNVENCITNSVTMTEGNFLIITGANMAGKSTFLRTIGLTFVMTNVGLPIFAKNIEMKPQKLISSMRTEDSLKDDESYFFAELKRLKYIIETIGNAPHFIILDEILKGTNSKDKEEGSKQFVQKLVKMSASGIIATHDLGLCTLSNDLPEIQNFYFDAEIINDELHFDYKMKDGVCKNMNASFLLRKMEIV